MDILSIVAFIATTILASIGLSPSPNAVGIVGLLVTLQLHPRLFSRRADKLLSPWVASTIGTAISHTQAASNALQTSSLSMVLLAVISATISLVPVAVIYIDAQFIGKSHRYTWYRLAGPPAFWASTWGIISMLTPIGRLLTWSPVTGIGPYTWISSYLGPWGIDFIVAAWSIVLTEAIAVPLSRHVLLTQGSEDLVTPYTDNPDEPAHRDRSSFRLKSAFTMSLLALTIPSLWTTTIPNPTYTSITTPFTVGCALPQTHLPHRSHHSPTLDHYINETRKMTNTKLVLWPEGALKFETEAERNKTFATMAAGVLKDRKGLHIGVGFEEVAPESRNKRASKRNGFALLVGDKIVLQYYKRNLVPVAESFSMVPSDEEPTIYKLPLGPPSGTHKPDWTEGPDYTRSIPITSSICLDFASQSSFLSLGSRPALILAPARTWHPSVGLAMWNQARQRAHETGSTILWCDGGEGGLSGVIGGGFEEPLQFGEGSWTKTIGLTYPFPERKTFFTSTWVGNLGGFIVIWMLTGAGGLVIQAAAAVFHTRASLLAWNAVKVKQAAHRFTGLFHQKQPNDAEQGESRRLIEDGGQRDGILLDLDDDEHRQQTPAYGAAQHA